MTEASPYLLERLLDQIEYSKSSLSKCIELKGKESFETELEECKATLEESLKKFEEIIKKYPDDDEIKKQYQTFLSYSEERSTYNLEEEIERLDKFIHDLKHLIDWRIVESASGRTLGKKSFRSLRGDREKRGE